MRNEERIPSPPEAALSPLGKGRSGMRSENPSTISDGPPPFRQGRLSSEVEEVASVQVIFQNRKTADEIVSELWDKVEKLQKEIDALKEMVK